MKKVYKKWKKGKGKTEEYLSVRRNFKELCKKKEAAKIERWKEEIKTARTEAQIMGNNK